MPSQNNRLSVGRKRIFSHSSCSPSISTAIETAIAFRLAGQVMLGGRMMRRCLLVVMLAAAPPKSLLAAGTSTKPAPCRRGRSGRNGENEYREQLSKVTDVYWGMKILPDVHIHPLFGIFPAVVFTLCAMCTLPQSPPVAISLNPPPTMRRSRHYTGAWRRSYGRSGQGEVVRIAVNGMAALPQKAAVRPKRASRPKPRL